MYAKYLVIGALLIESGSALAHEAKGTHGGRIADAGSYHVEMIATSNTVDVFISDAGEKPVATSDFKGTAILVASADPSGSCCEPLTARAFPAARR